MRLLFHPVSVVIAAMSIQWVTIASVGPFSVKIAYLALCGVVLFASLNGRAAQASLSLLRQNLAWIAPYGLYLLILWLALFDSPGHNIAPRQVLYLLGVVALAGCLAAEPRAGTLLRVGAGVGILLFLLVVEVMAREAGLSWAIAVGHFLSTGDLNFVVYSFFRAVFNSLNPDGEISVKAAEKNAVAVCLLVASLLFRAGHLRRSFDWIGIGVTVSTLFLIMLLNTRSVMIVAGASLVLATVLRSASNRNEGPAIWVTKIIGMIAGVILAIILLTSDHPVFGLMSDRFAFEDASTGHRLAQYGWAVQQIEGNLLIGSGYAEASDHVIHNLFLSAWVHAGLIAFLLVGMFYLAIAFGWLWFVWRVIQRPSRWILPMQFEWVAVLPILPLFRVWLSGDAGHLFLGEWVALAAFFGLVLRNRMHQRKLAASIDGYLRPVTPAARPA